MKKTTDEDRFAVNYRLIKQAAESCPPAVPHHDRLGGECRERRVLMESSGGCLEPRSVARNRQQVMEGCFGVL